MKWDLSALDLPQMEYNGKTYYIHPDAGEMTYEEAVAYCERLTAYNHSDWFLPGQQELSQLFSESSQIGGFMYGAYWFENPYTNYDVERYLSFQGGSLTSSGKGRVRPVRCESSFAPALTLKQVHEGNWSTFEVTIPKSSRYTISKAGLCWADPNQYKNKTFTRIVESEKKEGTFRISLDYKKSLSFDRYYLCAFAELSDGRVFYSNEITLIRHEPIASFSLVRKDAKTINAIVDINDWGFPQDFNKLIVEITDDNRFYDHLYAKVERISVKEDLFHYENEWTTEGGVLYLFFNHYSHGSHPFNASGSFSSSIDKEMRSPEIKTLPVTNKTAVGLDDNTNIIYSMTLSCELVDMGYPEANSCGIIVSCTSSSLSIDNYDYMFTNKDIYEYYLDVNKKYSFDKVKVTPNGHAYIRAFAESDGGIGYGDLLTINFEEPVFSNVSVSSITSSSAKVSSTITNAGDPTYTERGLVYLRSALITNSDTYSSLYSSYKHKSTIPNNNVTGTWSEDVTGLYGKTEYAIFSYIAEGGVVWFSNVQHFTTQ